MKLWDRDSKMDNDATDYKGLEDTIMFESLAVDTAGDTDVILILKPRLGKGCITYNGVTVWTVFFHSWVQDW